MRILILGVKEYPARGLAKDMGGIDVFTSELSKRLLKRTKKLIVITRSLPGLKTKEYKRNLMIVRVPYIPFRLSRTITYNFSAFLQAIKILKTKHVDLMYTGETIAGFFTTFLKKMFKIPLVSKIGTFGSKQPEWPVYAKLFLRIFEKKTLSSADAVILTNKEGMRYAQELCKVNTSKFHLVPNAVDFEKFRTGRALSIRREFNISAENFVMLFVGRFTESKGLFYLVKALKILLSKKDIEKKNIKLLLVGDGPLYHKIKNKINNLNLHEQVLLPGLRRDLPDIMSAANVFCLPSLYEAFPLVILEAMSAGLPVVASNVGAIPEIINDRKNGLLVSPKNPIMLANAFYTLYKNKSLYNLIKENSLLTAQSYRWATLVTRYLELFDQAKNS